MNIIETATPIESNKIKKINTYSNEDIATHIATSLEFLIDRIKADEKLTRKTWAQARTRKIS